MNNPIEIYDGRTIPCSEKHGQIIAKWRALPVGRAFVLINNHDPVRLHKQFSELWPGTFAWQSVAKGPEEFHIQITKLKALPETTEAPPFSCGH
jgi:uncharacterized protein (DUF2249 family)